MRHYPFSVTDSYGNLHSQHRTKEAALREAARVLGEAWADFQGGVPSLCLTPRPPCSECGQVSHGHPDDECSLCA